jgi:hypothetical protein
MAKEIFDELKGIDEYVSLKKFVEWDDVIDVMNRGYIDLETIKFIFIESGVSNEMLNFEQFFEVVDLLNQVSVAIEDAQNDVEVDYDHNQNVLNIDVEDDPVERSVSNALLGLGSINFTKKKNPNRLN